MFASVIVCTYNRAESLRRTLTALQRQIFDPAVQAEILVVDNNSSDCTAEVVAEAAKESSLPIRYLFEPAQGLSRARNRGIQESRGEFLLFTDDDVIPEPNWMEVHNETFMKYEADCIGGKILPLWGQTPPTWLQEKKRYWAHLALLDRSDSLYQVKAGEGGWVYGANFSLRRSILEKVGFFRTDLGMRGKRIFRGEDGEMVRRIALSGGKVIYQPEAVVYHRVPRERMHKNYFRSIRFREGISQERMFLESNGAHVRTVPLWKLRSLLSNAMNAARYYATGRAGLAIDHEMVFWMELGQVVGTFRCGARSAPQCACPGQGEMG